MPRLTHISAPPGDIYWRYEVCPSLGANVLLLTIGGVCVSGQWYGPLGYAFKAWCPLPKEGSPPPRIQDQPFIARLIFAIKLIFNQGT